MVFGIATKAQLQNDVFCLTEERDYFQTKFLEQVSEIANLKDQLKNAKKEIDKLRLELMQQSMANLNSTVASANASWHDLPQGSSITNLTCPSSSLQHSKTPASPKTTTTTTAPAPLLTNDNDDDASSLTSASSAKSDDDVEGNEEVIKGAQTPQYKGGGAEDEDNDSAKDIRQSAEKLLQWANYRSSVNTHRTVTSTPDHSSTTSQSEQPAAVANTSLLDQTIPRTIQSSSLDCQDENDSYQNDDDDEEDLEHGESDTEDDCDLDHAEDAKSGTPRSRASRLLEKFESVVTSL